MFLGNLQAAADHFVHQRRAPELAALLGASRFPAVTSRTACKDMRGARSAPMNRGRAAIRGTGSE